MKQIIYIPNVILWIHFLITFIITILALLEGFKEFNTVIQP